MPARPTCREDYPHPEVFDGYGEWLVPGCAIAFQLGGEIVGGPIRGETCFLTAAVDLGLLRTAKRTFDVAGHCARPDVFSLSVDRLDTCRDQRCLDEPVIEAGRSPERDARR